jgi:hypothetical protein
MPNTPVSDLKNQAFWKRMAENSAVVQRMPAWMKGSPINKRTQVAAKITENKAIGAKASFSPNC